MARLARRWLGARVGGVADLESEGKRQGNAAALLAAFCDVGLCGECDVLAGLGDDGTADAWRRALLWRRGVATMAAE